MFQGNCSKVYLEKAFDNLGLRPEAHLENAKALGETSLIFLLHPTLTESEITNTMKVIFNVFELAQRQQSLNLLNILEDVSK